MSTVANSFGPKRCGLSKGASEMITVEELLEELSEILDAASTEERDLTDEEVERAEELDGLIEASSERNKKAVELRAKRSVWASVASTLANVGKPAGAQDTLERAFDHYMRTGKENGDIVELRAQGEAAGTEGGYLVPTGFRQKLVDRMVAFGGIANVVEQVTTDTGNPVPWPTVDDTANTGEIVEEGGTFSSGADLVFGNKSVGAYKYMAGGGSNLPLRVSVELAQDAGFDVQGLVSRKLGERIARIQSTHIVKGTGVNQPQGIVTGLTGIEIAADTAGVVYDDLITFIHSVDPAYRERGRWAFNDTSWAYIKKLKDAAGDPLWRPADANMATSAEGGSSMTLLGYPVTIDQAFVDIDVDDNTDNWGVFGDLEEGHMVRRVKDVTLIVNPWTRAANGQIEYTAWARMDATQQNTNAYVALTGETA